MRSLSALALFAGASVLLRAQTPRFAAHEIATGLRGGYQVIAADVNGDGKPDLIALAITCFVHVGFSYHTSSGRLLASAMRSGLPSPFTSAATT